MKSNAKYFVITFVIMNTWSILGRAEYASVLLDLEPLLINTQGEVVKTLENYIELEEKRLEKIKRFTEEYAKLHKSAIRNADNFLSNPVNAYLLVKRLTTDWSFVSNLIEESKSKVVVHNMTNKEVFPHKEDLGEAANAIIRLQDTYLLNKTKIMKGEVAGMKGNAEFTASDCFELGLNAYKERDYNRSELWFQETLNKLNEDEFQMVNKSVLLDHFSFVTFHLGNVQRAMELTLDLIEINPVHPRAKKNLKYYQDKIRKEANKSLHPDTKKVNESPNKSENKTDISEEDIDPIFVERYKKLCRGEHLQSPAQESRLSCRYTTSGSKFLLLQPAKEETLNLDPWIVVYHDVIRDRDIELLKEIAGPTLKRASVLDPETGLLEYAKYRVSKSGWLADEDHPRVEYISHLMEEITGLETDTAEYLQINRYGLGGHYAWHYDFTTEGEFDAFAEDGIGNRIATWLFYLSDVEAGGSTVFPDIDVQVKPIKGSAGFWFNLFKNGTGDLRTRHAACPVLAGTKWVANKWFHEKEQEFRRPCGLNPLE